MAGIFKEFIKSPLKHAVGLCTDPAYRQYYWLRTRYEKVPSGKQLRLKLDGISMLVPDIPSFFSAYEEIFVKKIYRFEADSKTPLIVDMGANIGLSAIFFKRLYPEARLVVYEADKNIFKILCGNLDNHGLKDVVRHNLAVWNSNCTLFFKPDNADGGHVSDEDSGTSVTAVDFSDILKEFDRIDFLKMDIEGAENTLLAKLANELDRIENLFIEYHSFRSNPQKLGELLSILEAKNFRYNIDALQPGGMPSNSSSQIGDFDLQVNIWAGKHVNIQNKAR